MSAADKELSRRFTELFSTGDDALADEVLGVDVVMHLGGQELRGISEVKGWLRDTARLSGCAEQRGGSDR